MVSSQFLPCPTWSRSLPCAVAAASPSLLQSQHQQQRRCYGAGGDKQDIPTTATSSPPSNPPAADSAFPNAEQEGQYSPEVEAQIRDWEEKLKALSPEDRELIISALLHPERQKASVMGGPGIGPKDADMVAAFTCGKCDYRMVKKFSKHAYTKGIVIVECPGCRAKHLLADNLSWFEDEATNIEDILREKGESFVRVGDGDYQVVDVGDGDVTPNASK